MLVCELHAGTIVLMAMLLNLRKRLRPKTRFNWVLSDFLRHLLVWKHEWKAKLSGRSFYCSALQGESEYNITINSDSTVSCNCQDYEGTGHIGDLRKESFEQVFFGHTANHFRRTLAKGKIPIAACVRCGDFKRLASRDARPPEARLPWRGIML